MKLEQIVNLHNVQVSATINSISLISQRTEGGSITSQTYNVESNKYYIIVGTDWAYQGFSSIDNATILFKTHFYSDRHYEAVAVFKANSSIITVHAESMGYMMLAKINT